VGPGLGRARGHLLRRVANFATPARQGGGPPAPQPHSGPGPRHSDAYVGARTRPEASSQATGRLGTAVRSWRSRKLERGRGHRLRPGGEIRHLVPRRHLSPFRPRPPRHSEAYVGAGTRPDAASRPAGRLGAAVRSWHSRKRLKAGSPTEAGVANFARGAGTRPGMRHPSGVQKTRPARGAVNTPAGLSTTTL
jgi:hypothetical protein